MFVNLGVAHTPQNLQIAIYFHLSILYGKKNYTQYIEKYFTHTKEKEPHEKKKTTFH